MALYLYFKWKCPERCPHSGIFFCSRVLNSSKVTYILSHLLPPSHSPKDEVSSGSGARIEGWRRTQFEESVSTVQYSTGATFRLHNEPD